MICACCVNHGVERRPPGGGHGIPVLRDRRVLEYPVGRGDMGRDLGVVHLRVADEERVDNRDADARSDIARQVVETGTFRALLRRQRRQRDRAERDEQKAEPGALHYADSDDLRLRYSRRPAGQA